MHKGDIERRIERKVLECGEVEEASKQALKQALELDNEHVPQNELKQYAEYFALDRYETFYYWQNLVRKPFVLVYEKTGLGQMPKVAYFFPDPDEYGLFPIVTTFEAFGVCDRASQPKMHALRIELPTCDLTKPKPTDHSVKFEIRILDQGTLDGWTDGFIFGQPPLSHLSLPTWQAELWEKIGLAIPPSHEMRRAIADTKITSSQSTVVTERLKDIDRIRLILCMLEDFWTEAKTEIKNRAELIGYLLGKKDFSTQALSQYRGWAGLKQPTRSQYIEDLRSIVSNAAKFFQKNPALKLDAEEWDHPPQVFLLPGDSYIHKALEMRMQKHRRHEKQRPQ